MIKLDGNEIPNRCFNSIKNASFDNHNYLLGHLKEIIKLQYKLQVKWLDDNFNTTKRANINT